MNDRHNTIRKAAILIASLDRATAEKLLSQMSREQAEAIIRAVSALGPIDPTEQEAVIDEFFRIGPMLPEDQPENVGRDKRIAGPPHTREQAQGSAGPTLRVANQPAGIDLDSQFAEEIAGYSRSNSRTKPSRQSPFRSLHDAAGTTLASRLRHEHPQTIAVVVSNLPPENAADLLANLSPSLQAEVARRLVDLEDTDPEILWEIERGLATWLNEHHRSSRRRTAGMMALENILAAADPASHETMLSNLARHDRMLARQLVARDGRAYRFNGLM
jgi:flagellar motor switch protein FliG